MTGNPWRSHDWPIYVICALPPLGAFLLIAAELSARISGGAWLPVTGTDWLSLAIAPLRHRLSPGDAWPASARAGAPGPLAYWTTLVLFLVATTALVVVALRRRGSAPARGRRAAQRLGFARADEVREVLDGRSAGRVAYIPVQLHVTGGRVPRVNARDWLLPGADRPADEVGVPLGRDAATGRELWGTWEDSFGSSARRVRARASASS